ncbi:PB1 domain-containing protein [Artemisia annua]|uniref:PB1 domain-containing protein n=1 Tax=Artemisia annua TaxID=35608 RepID=A0A2U1KXC1_ARTAN|nr:PB1 domain-containing protein [Artemisia annua]
MSSEPPSVAFSGESRYLTPLCVFGKADELSQSTITGGYELIANEIDPHNQIVEDKIKAVLKLLTFREQRVLVQFWSPCVVGKHQLLTTIDQPFGLGVNHDERLLSYRRVSQHNLYVVDKDYEEVDLSPLARVFKLGLSEWSSDLNNYLPKDFPQQECAIRCNLHGYLVLPVFDSTTRLCVGMLELLASSKYMSFNYEVQQFETALKTQKLTCLQVSDDPASNVNESRPNELEKIFNILKDVCDTHQLPLAQTWALSPFTSVASYEQVLEKSCNSYDSRCLGKVCMSTCALPYYVQNLGLWPFREECKKQHLDKSRGFVSRALSSGGSCFCEDVTKLGEEVYPLVHYARTSGLTSCFTIHMHGCESNNDYVLEFFLPSHMKESKHLMNLVQMLKQNLEVASGFELGDKSFIEVVGPPMDLSVNIEPDIMDTCSNAPDIARTDFVDVPDECSSTNVSFAFSEGGETSSPLKRGRKCKRGSKNMVYVKATYGENSKGFWFSISSGLWKLKNKVAKRFKLKRQMICLKYWDEDNDLILFSSNDNLEFAKIASGDNKRINLICESVRHHVD